VVVVFAGLSMWLDFGAPVSLWGLLAVLAAAVGLHLVLSCGSSIPGGGDKWFPGWAGPAVGAYFGLLTAFSVSGKNGQPLTVGLVVACVAGGLIVGGIMWLLDLIRRAPRADAREPASRDAAVEWDQT
jgi:hypothetical protein